MKYKGPQKYKNKLYLAFVAIWIVPLLLLTIFDYYYIYNTTRSSMESYTISNLEIAAKLIDSDLSAFSGIVSSIALNEEVAQIAAKDTAAAEKDFNETQRLYIITQISMAGLPEHVPIHIVNRDKKSRLSTTDYYLPYYIDERGNLYHDMEAAADAAEIVHKVHWRVDSENRQDICYVLGQAILSADEKEVVGYVILDIYKSYFQDIFSTIVTQEGANLVLLDRTGTIVTDQNERYYTGFKFDSKGQLSIWDQKGSFQMMIDDQAFRVYYDTAPVSQMKVVELIPESRFAYMTLNNMKSHIIVYLLLLLVGMVMIRRNVRFISSPVNRMVEAMTRFKEGDYSVRVRLEGDDEVARLGESFNDMSARIQTLIEDNYEKQNLLHQAEMKALKAQVTPHFLYNCLNSSYMMARIGKTEDVKKMTKALSAYYRNRVDSTKDVVTVQEELDQVANYLEIQKMRYLDKMEYRLEVDAAVADKPILKLLLQPIAENAVIHGIEQRIGKGEIVIQAAALDGGVLIRVMDNGNGFGASQAKGEGVGLENIRQRLAHAYGREYRLDVIRREPYTVVEVWFRES